MAKFSGGAFPDFLRGTSKDDHLIGTGDDDTIVGGSGHDRIWGGSGDDELNGGRGNDYLEFTTQEGNDAVFDFGHGDTVTLVGVSVEDIQENPDGYFSIA